MSKQWNCSLNHITHTQSACVCFGSVSAFLTSKSGGRGFNSHSRIWRTKTCRRTCKIHTESTQCQDRTQVPWRCGAAGPQTASLCRCCYSGRCCNLLHGTRLLCSSLTLPFKMNKYWQHVNACQRYWGSRPALWELTEHLFVLRRTSCILINNLSLGYFANCCLSLKYILVEFSSTSRRVLVHTRFWIHFPLPEELAIQVVQNSFHSLQLNTGDPWNYTVSAIESKSYNRAIEPCK